MKQINFKNTLQTKERGRWSLFFLPILLFLLCLAGCYAAILALTESTSLSTAHRLLIEGAFFGLAFIVAAWGTALLQVKRNQQAVYLPWKDSWKFSGQLSTSLPPKKQWILWLVVITSVGVLSWLNEQLIYLCPGAWGKKLQTGMLQQSAMMETMFAHVPLHLTLMQIVVVALLTAYAEEIFFRGTLQQALYTITGSQKRALWITAIFFTVLHFNLYSLLPMFLLALLLGTLRMHSQSIATGVLIHALNNSATILYYAFFV